MPEYTYICKNGHERIISESMVTDNVHTCDCGHEMWRKPQSVGVNWGGIAPSQGDWNPTIASLIDTKDERRDWFEKMHEEHEKETADE